MDRPIRKKRWTLKKIGWMAAALVFLGLVTYSYLASRERRLNVESDRLTIATIRQGLFQEFIPVIGSIVPGKTIYLDAMEGGRVEKIFAEAGSMVQANQPLLQLANTNLLPDLLNREAQVIQEKNNLSNFQISIQQLRLANRQKLAELDFEIQQQQNRCRRNEELARSQLISNKDYEEDKEKNEFLLKRRELMVETQKQDEALSLERASQLGKSIRLLDNNLALARQKLESLIIRAPISGQLTAITAEMGESKAPGQRLGQIDVEEGFKVRVEIDEHYINRVRAGQTGKYESAESTMPVREEKSAAYELVVQKVYPEVMEGKFRVDMVFQGPLPSDIRRGQSLHIRLELGASQMATLLPRGGFYQKTGGQWIYVLDSKKNIASKRNIRLGRQNPEFLEVLEGLRTEEQVIVSSYDNYGDVDVLVLKGQ